MSKLGKRLINAAKSAQAIAKGEADPKTYKVHVPAHLDVRAIRTKLKMSQNAFAARFGILPSTRGPCRRTIGRTGWGPTLIFR
jgi:DNA-binding transcriptional regulator YiaG